MNESKGSRSNKSEDTFWAALWNYVTAGVGNENSSGQPVPNADYSFRKNVTVPKKSSRSTTFEILPGTSWISALELSLWDNISGPRVEHVWKGQQQSPVSEEALIYVARHTLCGDIDSIPSIHELSDFTPGSSHVESKFHIFSEIGYLSLSALFIGIWLGNTTKFSLSLIMERKHLDRYLVLQSVIEDRIMQLVCKLQALLMKMPSIALKTFSSQLEVPMCNLEYIFRTQLPAFSFSQTLFCLELPNQHHNNVSSQQLSISNLGSIPMAAPLYSMFDKEFIARCITSHLQTHGCTVIVGRNEEKINMFIYALSLFLIIPEERTRASIVHGNRGYVPDLLVQGVLLSGANSNGIPDDQIVQSMLPSTIIDLEQLLVKQTHPFHEYMVLRKEFMTLEIDRLTSSGPKKSHLWDAQGPVFNPVKTSAPYISHIVNEAFQLPAHLREAFLRHSMNLLIRKTALLIKYVQTELSKSSAENLEAAIVKKIRTDLDLLLDTDFNVLLGIAEKLNPGIYTALAGDPASIELKFIELFESF